MTLVVNDIDEDDLYRTLQTTALVAQKRTGMHKALVYLDPAQRDVVYKGPYAWPEKQTALTQMLFRRELFVRVWRSPCAVAGPFELLRFACRPDSVYIRMPHVWPTPTSPLRLPLFGEKATILGEPEQRVVASKYPQEIEEFSAYLETSWWHENDVIANDGVIYQALVHFMHRALVDPIVGDPALRNVLVCYRAKPPYGVGIDFEENRSGDVASRLRYETLGVIPMLCGGKRWPRKHCGQFALVLRARKADFLAHLCEIDTKWDAVRTLIAEFGVTCDIVAMQRRLRTLSSDIEREFHGIEPAATRAKRARRE